MRRKRPGKRHTPRLRLTTAPQGADPLGKAARSFYSDDARPALLAMALLEATLAEAAAITDPDERQSVLNTCLVPVKVVFVELR